MAIKKAPIIGAYNINLYCDKCGGIMKFQKTTFKDSVQYLYICSCGHEEISDTIYPYQILELDRSKEEVIE